MIETRDLTKKYGELFAIKSIDLNLSRGDVFGFIGPNGAGKTTTMRILATLLNPTWGEAYVGGHSIYTQPKEIRRMIGYMPDFFGVYDDMKVIEYLEFFAAAYRIRGPEAAAGLRRSARPGRARLQARSAGHQPVARHDAAAGPGARAAARSAGAAARRTGQRPRPAGTHRNSHAAQAARHDGQDDHGLEPHPAGAGRHLQQGRHHRARRADVQRHGGRGDEASAAADGAQHRRGRRSRRGGASCCEGHKLVERVDVGDKYLTVTLADGHHDYSDLATLLVGAGHKLTLFREEELNLETAFMALTKGITS